MIKENSYGVIPLRKEEGGVKVLLIFHKKGKHWGFPKGHKDPGESDFEAAQRELREETGLMIVECLASEPFSETYHFYKREGRVSKTVCYYPAFVEGKLVLQPEEIVDARWVFLQEAKDHLSFKGAKDICSRVGAFLENM